jgi:hypothetical protein
MKNLTSILIALALTTCIMLHCTSEQRKQREAQFVNLPDTTKWLEADGKHVHVVVIDSCEYIALAVGANFGLLTHKGNCNNSFHRKK